MNPDESPAALAQMFQVAVRHHKSGNLSEAEKLCKTILANNPDHAEALHLLGLLNLRTGNAPQAINLFNRAITLRPTAGIYFNNLSTALQNNRQLPEAILAARRAVELLPNSPQCHNTLGNALQSRGQLPDAITAYRKVISLNPNIAEAWNNLGNAHRQLGQLSEATAAFQRAMQLRPDAPEIRNNFAAALLAAGNLDAAADQFQHALQLKPTMAIAANNLANTFKDMGRLDEAIIWYKKTLDLNPAQSIAHSNYLYMLTYHPNYDSAALLHAAKQWNDQHAAHIPQFQSFPNDPNPNRPLRIGYVSPNFFRHCQAHFMLPLLANHDPKQFQIFCYSDVAAPDDITRKLTAHAHTWKPTLGQTDAELASQIHTDRIDILVDLTQHMSRHRLLTFARKPAPIQVSWLGYPGTTGIPAIDYRLTDPHLDPPDTTDEFYTEKSIRLPHTFWCYDPLTTEPPVNNLPALTNGHITFGCLNNFCKINTTVLRLWAQVLKSIPESKLILLAPPGSPRAHLLQQFHNLGIAQTRIQFTDFLPRDQYLNLHHAIDIGLDTFPYNGHTTTLDSLWMGVPVLTLLGKTIVGRAGLSQWTNLNLHHQWVADTESAFLRLATHWTQNLPALSALRQSLRPLMQNSPLMNSPTFTRNIEQAYRQMWQIRVAGLLANQP